MKSFITRAAHALCCFLKPVFIVAVCVTLAFFIKTGAEDFKDKRYGQVNLFARIQSPTGKWVLEIHKDDPSFDSHRGVFRIFRVTDGQLELDFRVSRATLQAETQPFWIGDDLYFFRGGLEVIRFPASLLEKAWAYLP